MVKHFENPRRKRGGRGSSPKSESETMTLEWRSEREHVHTVVRGTIYAFLSTSYKCDSKISCKSFQKILKYINFQTEANNLTKISENSDKKVKWSRHSWGRDFRKFWFSWQSCRLLQKSVKFRGMVLWLGIGLTTFPPHFRTLTISVSIDKHGVQTRLARFM